jgi:hypothetical protein
MTTMGIQGGIGGLLSGAIAKTSGQSFLDAAIGGAIGGMLGGGAGYAVNAFLPSLAGLIGTLAAHSAVGGLDAGVSAFATSYYNERDFGIAIHDALWAAALGAATGGFLDAARPLFRPKLSTLRFSDTVRIQLQSLERFVPRSVIEDVLENGAISLDPLFYENPARYINNWQFLRQMWIGGKWRTVKIIWNAEKNMVLHIHYYD